MSRKPAISTIFTSTGFNGWTSFNGSTGFNGSIAFRQALGLALAALLAAGCSRLGVGARVHDLGDGRYRIVASQAPDAAGDNDPTGNATGKNAAAENAKAARDTCPGGYTVLKKGAGAEGLYGSLVLGADLATVWIIRCGVGK